MISCLILLLYAYTVHGMGYDSGGGDQMSCGRPYRAGRAYQPPCDIVRHGYCTQPGPTYPWRAMRKFVKDNQGLMRRMYGDQRHGHVLKLELEDDEEFERDWESKEWAKGGYEYWKPTPVRFAKYQHNEDIDNELDEELDFDVDDQDEEEPRYLRDDLSNDDVLNTKFVLAEPEAAIAIKLTEFKAAAHFRPLHHKAQYTTPKIPSSSPKTSTSTTATTTQKPTVRNTTTSRPMNSTLQSVKKGASTGNGMANNENATIKLNGTKTLTEALEETTEESVLTTTTATTTDDFSDISTIDTTTQRTTERFSKKPSTTTRTYITKIIKKNQVNTEKTLSKQSTTQQPLASDRIANDVNKEENSDSMLGNNKPNNSNDSTEAYISDTPELLKQNGDILGEASEQNEAVSDSNSDQKPGDTNNKPALLFQDMNNYDMKKGVNACPFTEEVVAPYWVYNTRGQILTLLNQHPYQQYVHIEKCTHEFKQMYCREGCRCEQQFRLYRLLAFDPTNECKGIFSDWFRFPSFCVCKCYNIPPEFRVTSRSPRFHMPDSEGKDDSK